MTTNGALLSEEKIRFLDKHQFSVELSFDGLAQVIRRDRKSYDKVIQIIARILERQNIRLETNSVFDAWSVSYLSESVASIIGLGVRNISLSFSILTSWDRQSLGKLEQEMANLGRIQLPSYQRTGEIRLVDFREDDQKGVFYCAAGRDRFAVSTDGTVWGCPLFADYFAGRENSPQYKEYCFGNLGRPGSSREMFFPGYAPIMLICPWTISRREK